jgi:uncharacterized protein (DUF433 family)
MEKAGGAVVNCPEGDADAHEWRMTLSITAAPPPLTVNTDGVVRVGGTRVTLDTLVRAFQEGATAEEIAQQYPSLRLADIYTAIGYYLQHQAEVEEYLRWQQQEAEEVRRQNEARFDPNGVRVRLLARRRHAT